MNAKEAREILDKHSREGHFTDVDKHGEAKGFLDSDAQWKEKVKPLVEALEFCSKPEGAYSRDHGQHAINCLKESMDKAIEALSQFRKQRGEE